jgi:hemerythrin
MVATNPKKMLCARWNNDYSLGIASIDDQHKKLFAMMNQFCAALDKNPDRRTGLGKASEDAAVQEVIDEMGQYADVHFTLEEKYFEQFRYPKMLEHMAQHEVFRLKTHQLREELDKGNDTVALETMQFLSNWFVNHILTVDKEYVQCFHDHGL